nr:glycoprotein [Chuviridae sp.]
MGMECSMLWTINGQEAQNCFKILLVTSLFSLGVVCSSFILNTYFNLSMLLLRMVLLGSLVRLTLSENLIGYDCLEQSTNITAVGLDFVKSCSYSSHPPDYRDIYIQVLQSKMKSDIHITSCLIFKSYFMTHCGMHSHNSLVSEGFGAREIVKIADRECKILHQEGYISFNGFRIEGLRKNALQARQVVDVGKFDTNGNCEGGSVSMKGRWYSNVARQTNYEILLTSHEGSLDLDTSNVITANGYRYPFADGEGFDPQLGYLFWDHPTSENSCTDHQYVVLYEGIGTIASYNNSGQTLIVNTTSFVFAIELKRPTILCGSHGFITEHPKLLILQGTPNSFSLKTHALSSTDIDQFLYVNSKFVYMERHFQGQLDSLYYNLITKICDLKHQQLKQLSSLAYIDPEVFAWAYTGKPGVTALMAGEVVYLMQCKPKPMVFRSVDRCYLEIPVNNSGVVGYLRPRTRIFIRYGTEVACNPLTPTMFKMGLHWVQLSPQPSVTQDPKTLSDDDHNSWSYSPSTHLMTAGLYTTDILQEYSARLLYPMERSAIQNIIGATSTGQDMDIQDINLKGFVTPNFVEEIEKTASQRVWGWYNTIVMHTSGFVGIYLICRLVLWTVAFILNCKVLYDVFGVSYKLFGALWGVLTKHLMFAYLNQKTTIVKPSEAGVELEEISSPATAPVHETLAPLLSPEKECHITPAYSVYPVLPSK